MKITEDELNLAYAKVNELKKTGDAERVITVDVDRNPLVDSNFFDEDSNFAMPVKLQFEFDPTCGAKGAYLLTSEVTVIPAEEEDEA